MPFNWSNGSNCTSMHRETVRERERETEGPLKGRICIWGLSRRYKSAKKKPKLCTELLPHLLTCGYSTCVCVCVCLFVWRSDYCVLNLCVIYMCVFVCVLKGVSANCTAPTLITLTRRQQPWNKTEFLSVVNMPSDELCKLHKNPSFICERNVVHYDDAFITWARREQESEREREKKLTNNSCFFLKNKGINTKSEYFYRIFLFWVERGDEKTGRGGKYIQVEATQS